MELKGKKVCFLGDSITFGVGPSDDSLIYHALLSKEMGFTAYNYGLSASCIARKVESVYDIWDKMPMCLRVEDIPDDCDLLVIFGGTNDYGRAIPLSGREGTDDLFTFRGALKHLLTRAKERLPNAKTLFMTPFPRANAEKSLGFDSAPLDSYVKEMYRLCNKFSVLVCDLYSLVPLDPKNQEHIRGYFPDGLHPNDVGHRIIADILKNFLITL